MNTLKLMLSPRAPRVSRSLPRLGLLAAAVALALSGAAQAASFSIVSGTTSTAQTLGSGSGQTGSVAAGATLTTSGSSNTVTISGNNATLTNLGTMTQTGTGRVIRDNTGVSGLMITNGSTSNSTATMRSADGDVIQMNKSPASVTVNNYGQMISDNASAGGAQVIDFNAIASGSNIVNNYAGALMQAAEADAVRPGVNGVVNNWGTIRATSSTGSSSDGIDMQTNTGAQVNNNAGGLIEGARHGITGGAADANTNFTLGINNAGTIAGKSGSGINIDGFNAREVVTIVNSGTITGNGVTGDGDGIDVDGVVNITNTSTGVIRSLNSFSSGARAQSEGITVGGGTITNAGLIEGNVAAGNSNAVGRGITVAGVDTSGAPEAIYANTVITNQAGGIIRGQSDSAIVVEGAASGFTVAINNNAGASIIGGGTTAAAIRTGADNDTITNSGLINGAASGKAIDMGAGNNTLYITGGAASVIGDISGGVGGSNKMIMDPGAGNSFAYSGSISNFNSVEVKSGNVTLSGANTYTGATTLSGGTLTLSGGQRLDANSGLILAGGNLSITDYIGANAQAFSSLSLLENAVLDLGNSSLTFDRLDGYTNGKTLTVLDYLADISPTYAIRFLGDLTSDLRFLALMSMTSINGSRVAFSFDGVYTDIVTAVPEPASLALVGLALAMIAMARRRRANR